MAVEETLEYIQEFPTHYKVIMDRLNEQRQQDQFTDITLIVDGDQFKAHKAVLAACSQFFYKFFQDFTQEPLVEIEGVSNLAFRHLIEFTYTAKLTVQSEEEANDVWKAAEYLQMHEAIKALDGRSKDDSSTDSPEKTQGNTKVKKRKIAETSNVITETLPSMEGESVEIEVEIADGTVEVEEEGLETLEEVTSTEQLVTEFQGTDTSDDSALALLADITSKYQQDDRKPQVVEEEEESTTDSTVNSEPTNKQVEGIEIVEVQLSHIDNLFRCEKCNRSFKLFYHFKEHLKLHSSESFKCQICNKRYTRESAWRQHLSVYHLEEGGSAKKPRPGKKIHVCQYCDKQFDHFGHFKEHLRKHTGEKPFECPNCHERFARNSTLKCHLTACQSGVGAKKGRKKLYECQVCNSVFNSWDQFKDHLVIHTGEKPNHCTVCDVWFMQSNELRKHLKEIHDITERIVTEVVLPVEAIETESTTIIEQVEQVHMVPIDQVHVEQVIQVHMDSAELSEEEVQPDLSEDSDVKSAEVMEIHAGHMQVDHLEVEQLHIEQVDHTEVGQVDEVHMEELHVEHVNQIQLEDVQTDIVHQVEVIETEHVEQLEMEEVKEDGMEQVVAHKMEQHEQVAV